MPMAFKERDAVVTQIDRISALAILSLLLSLIVICPQYLVQLLVVKF